MTEPNWVCVYCGLEEPDDRDRTRDHVPPRNLFPEPRPSDLITVPCCRNCNNSASKDDEYFRSLLVREKRVDEHSQVHKVKQSFIRSLDQSKAPGFSRSILNNVIPVETYTPAGIYTGLEWGYYVENDRLDRVLERIVKGLYWKECRMRLPDEYRVMCWDEYRIAELDRDNQVVIYNSFIPMIGPPQKVIGNRTFIYWFRNDELDKCKTAWVLGFYSRVFFFCITRPKE